MPKYLSRGYSCRVCGKIVNERTCIQILDRFDNMIGVECAEHSEPTTFDGLMQVREASGFSTPPMVPRPTKFYYREDKRGIQLTQTR
jgi:hypothetical protein